MTRLTLTARKRLTTYASLSRLQSDEETFDMRLPNITDDDIDKAEIHSLRTTLDRLIEQIADLTKLRLGDELVHGNVMGRIAIALFGDQNNRTDEECVARAAEIGYELSGAKQRAERAEAELAAARANLEIAECALLAHGYRKSCDIPACNCGDQWHHGGNAVARLVEIRDAISERESFKNNGKTILQCVKECVRSDIDLTEARARVEKLEGAEEDRDEYQRQAKLYAERCAESDIELEAARADADAVRELMNCYNVGGWTDAKGPIHRALVAEKELAAARALLDQCQPHIRGNVGAWEQIRPELGPDGQRSTDNAIAEGRALLVAIDTALGGK